MKSISYDFASFGTTKAIKLIQPIFESFFKNYYFPKSHCHIAGPSKMMAVQYLSIFNKLLLQYLLKHKCYRTG